MLNWTNRFNTFCFLDNHGYQIEPHTAECLVAAGAIDAIACNAGDALLKLQDFINQENRWLFGHLGYDLKNEIEQVTSGHADHLSFPDVFFFQPGIVIRFNETEMVIESYDQDPEKVYEEILSTTGNHSPKPYSFKIQNRIDKEEYISIIERLREHIHRGDCYEINFCQEFFSENADIDPLIVYKNLTQISPNPFAALYRLNDKWLLCASPERFLKKKGSKILSQPIKGTSSRSVNPQQDEMNKKSLSGSSKDRSENVMVVDLVRNDLSKICKDGSVKVDELYGIYSFPQVHQMISTVSGELKDDITFAEIIRSTFPMGSMTGAPKKKVMELIEKYEKVKRGIFSGALGYITPAGDFDFNVVIRSIMYNSSNKYLSFQAGSGITYYSDAEKEWEECIWKAEAMRKVLS